GGYRAAALGFYQRNNANPSYQEQRQFMEETLSKFMSESAKRHEENFNIIKEIRASTDVAVRNQRASIKTQEIQIGQISKVLQERGFRNLPSSTKANSRDHVKSISTTAEADSKSIRHIRSPQYAELASLDPLYEDYIELNDLNVPLELRRDQFNDLMPTIEEGEIHIDYAYNLRFSCMIGFEHVDANFFPILSINMMSREFYNSIMRDEVEHKEKNVVGAFMNVLIFVRKFSFVTHFIVVENMDGYQDQDMGDIILGEPFCKSSCVEARRFNRLITIHNSSDNVTYQMA
ncbi:hypothetical protein Tco_0915856, partial [Tanacetum coccineum]